MGVLPLHPQKNPTHRAPKRSTTSNPALVAYLSAEEAKLKESLAPWPDPELFPLPREILPILFKIPICLHILFNYVEMVVVSTEDYSILDLTAEPVDGGS